MTYATNIDRDHIEVNYFVRVGSRSLLSKDWTDYGDGVTWYKDNWEGQPIGRTNYYIHDFGGGAALQQFEGRLAPTFTDLLGLSIPTVNTTFNTSYYGCYYDAVKNRMYLRTNGAAPDPSVYDFWGERFFFMGTVSAGLPIKPDDSSYDQDVQYHGIIRSVTPAVISTSDVIYGFMPAQTGQIVVGNDDGYLSGDFFDGSLSDCKIEIYRCVGEILPENMQLIMSGLTRGVTYGNGKEITISYVDASALLDASFYTSYFGSTAQPDVVNKSVRGYLCGNHYYQRGVVASSYNAAASTSNNRSWTFGGSVTQVKGYGGVNAAYAVYTTDNALTGSNTTTRTYLDSVVGLAVGDWIIRNTTTSAVLQVSAVGANYIDHTATTTLGASDVFRKTKIQAVRVGYKSGGPDVSIPYTEISSISDYTVTFKTTLEANAPLSGTLHPETHFVSADIEASLGSSKFPHTLDYLGSVNTATGCRDNPVQAIFEILANAGFYEDEDFYDEDSFVAAATAADIRVSVSGPRTIGQDTPATAREIIAKICQTCLLKVYMKNGKWYCHQIEPLGASTDTVNVDNVKSEPSYSIVAEDTVSEMIVKYNGRDVNVATSEVVDTWSYASVQNLDIFAVNNKKASKTIELMIGDQTQAETMRDRYLYIFSQPIGILTIEMDLSKIDLDLGQVITIDVEEFEDLPFTVNKDFSVVGVTENDDTVTVALWDQRGIEENSGSW